jgi:hypothetical protein
VTLNAITVSFTSVSGAAPEDFTATIDWGDGSSGTGQVVRRSASFAVVGSHTYATAGIDFVTTTIENAGQATFTATSKCKVRATRMPARLATAHHAKKDVVANDRLVALVDLILLR